MVVAESLDDGALLVADREDLVPPPRGPLHVHEDHRVVLERRLHRLAEDFNDAAVLGVQAVPPEPVVPERHVAEHVLVVGLGASACGDAGVLHERHRLDAGAGKGQEPRPGIVQLAHPGPFVRQVVGESGGGLKIVGQAREVVERDLQRAGRRDHPVEAELLVARFHAGDHRLVVPRAERGRQGRLRQPGTRTRRGQS